MYDVNETAASMTTQAIERPRVFYVAGLPRTGSTVLGKTLGGLRGAVFVGELAFFWRRYANRELCSCGQPLPDCPFWSSVIAEAFGDMTNARAEELRDLERQVRRRQWVIALSPVRWTPRSAKRVTQVLEERTRLYDAISKVTNAKWIVDSGKETVFGCVVARIKNVNLSTVHIVRDPRGVAFSWKKRILSDSETGHMPQRSTAVTAAHWLLENSVIQLSLRRLSHSYIRVRYEDLVVSTDQMISNILHSTSVPVDATSAGPSYCNDHSDHLVAGNPGVRQLGGSALRLTLDEEWRTYLPRAEQWLVTMICGALMAAYGYRLRPTRCSR